MGSKQNHIISPQDIESVHVLCGFRKELCKLTEKKVHQELLNTHATFGLRNSGAELITDGWDAILEKYCREPVLLLGI